MIVSSFIELLGISFRRICGGFLCEPLSHEVILALGEYSSPKPHSLRFFLLHQSLKSAVDEIGFFFAEPNADLSKQSFALLLKILDKLFTMFVIAFFS
jgi:hypothetical protein